MAETMVENRTCLSCGAEARPGALFCYNCGNSVIQEVGSKNEITTSNVWFRKEIVESETQKDEVELPENDKPDGLIEKETVVENKKKNTEKIIKEISEKKAGTFEVVEDQKSAESKLNVIGNTKLRSASALRKRGKFLRTGKIEVIWEEREGAPNTIFLIVALFLVLLALGMFFLAMYLR